MDNNRQRDLLQEFINKPTQKGLTEEQILKSYDSTVASCEDLFKIYIEIVDEKISIARFSGEGCAVSMGAVEAVLRVVEGKEIKEVNKILNDFESLIDNKLSEINIEELDVFSIVQTHLSRRKCARAPIEAIRKAIR